MNYFFMDTHTHTHAGTHARIHIHTHSHTHTHINRKRAKCGPLTGTLWFFAASAKLYVPHGAFNLTTNTYTNESNINIRQVGYSTYCIVLSLTSTTHITHTHTYQAKSTSTTLYVSHDALFVSNKIN